MKGKTDDLNHDLTFSAHTINCVCHSIRSIFRVLGIYITLSKGKVKEVSNKNGFWKWSKFGNGEHDGWLYQENPGDLSNKKVTYIYDDFSTVIHGTFENKILIEGYASKIVAFRCHQVMEHP